MHLVEHAAAAAASSHRDMLQLRCPRRTIALPDANQAIMALHKGMANDAVLMGPRGLGPGKKMQDSVFGSDHLQERSAALVALLMHAW